MNVVVKHRLSATRVGALNDPELCERCFSVGWAMGWRTPRAIPFPGIFNKFDKHVKGIIRDLLDKEDRLPGWVPPIARDEVVGYVPPGELDWRRFHYVDEETGIDVTAAPDEILVLRSEPRNLILDYKMSSADAKTADSLLPRYVAQLAVEEWIGERTGKLRTRGVGLLYFDPIPGEGQAEDDLRIRFKPMLKRLHPEPGLVRSLLTRAAVILATLESGRLPEGKAGCFDCKLSAQEAALRAGASPVTYSPPIGSYDVAPRERNDRD